jgi:hypothetical protein
MFKASAESIKMSHRMVWRSWLQQAQRAHQGRVFISYSRKDIAFADRLGAALKARGFEPSRRSPTGGVTLAT